MLIAAAVWVLGGAGVACALASSSRAAAAVVARRRVARCDLAPSGASVTAVPLRRVRTLSVSSSRVHLVARRASPIALPVLAAAMSWWSRSALPIVAAALIGVAVVQWRRMSRIRRQRAFDTAMPAYVDGLVRSLRSGRSVREAIDAGTGSGSVLVDAEISEVRRELAAGVPLADALESWSGRSRSVHVPPLCAVLRLGDNLGGSLASALDGCARTARDQIEVQDEVRALTSQARASAWSVAALPLGASAMLASLDPGVAHFLLRTWAGTACIVVALLLDGIAVLWMSAAIEGST